MALHNDSLIKALLAEPHQRTPVWMMRQAGRYLPEYRQLRQQQPDFIKFCQTPELCCEATLQPLARFDFDAAIIFSDILTIPDAMGMELEFVSGKGPVFAKPLTDTAAISALKSVGAPELQYVMDAISTTKKALQESVPLLGFSGSPWTLACYMIEGSGSKVWLKIRSMLYQQPELLHRLLQLLAECIVRYVNGQIEAGADAIMLFDTWGGILAHQEYCKFSLHYMNYIANNIHRNYNGKKIPLVFFTKHAAPWLDHLGKSDCDGVGLDSSIDLASAVKIMPESMAIQGNLDPAILFADPKSITQQVHAILDVAGGRTGFVFNLGHGIDKDTPIAGVEAMLAAVRSY